MGRQIMHVDVDAFFASVEQILDPRLRGKPVVVGSGVIASCSYEARRFGLHAGMPLRKARELCPKAVFLDGRNRVYRCFTARLFEILEEYTPSVESGLDEAFCDLTGFSRLYPDPRALGFEVQARVLAETGLPVTVGLGPNRMAAKIAGKTVKPAGVRAIRDEAELADLIAPMPVSVIPGVGRKVGKVLEGLNVSTVSDLRRLPETALVSLFGANGRAIFERALGRDSRQVEPPQAPRSISRETTFHEDVSDRREVEGMLQYLCGRAARAARAAAVSTGNVSVRIAYSDFRRENASKSVRGGAHLDCDVFAAALALLDSIWTRRASLRLVGVALSAFSPLAPSFQATLFGEDVAVTKRRERLVSALDSIRDRFGHASVVDGKSLNLLCKLGRDDNGFVLRTPCLTK